MSVSNIGRIDHLIAVAPLPTPATLRRRQNVVVQAGRGVALMARILRMVVKGHEGHDENERVDQLAVQERKKLRAG